MDLERITKRIEGIFKLNNKSPFALAMVGSRVVGYHTSKSDYDFNAVFEENFGRHYINFSFNSKPISVKIQTKEKFEESLIEKFGSSEQSRFSILPYIAIKNKEYFQTEERKSRKKIINNFIQTLPSDKEIITSINSIVEWPLIERSLRTPDYTGRLRRISRSNIDFRDIMVPKYIETLKDMGYFIHGDNTMVLKNNAQEKWRTYFFSEIKDKYEFAKRLDLDSYDFMKGSLLVALQMPYEIFNEFEKLPRIKNVEGNWILDNPSIEEFLHKRRFFIPIERITKSMKDNLLKSLTEK